MSSWKDLWTIPYFSGGSYPPLLGRMYIWCCLSSGFPWRREECQPKALEVQCCSFQFMNYDLFELPQAYVIVLSCALSCLNKSLGPHFWFLIFVPLFRQWDLKGLFRLQVLSSQVEFHIESDSDFLSKSPSPGPLKLSSCTYFTKSIVFLKWVFVEIYLDVGAWLFILFHKLPLWTTLL